ncbi:Carbamoyl-phosphate synthase small chain [Commensalibacter sp. Nvir]|uniref:glutamine-hydrolyzing carbamoyl-phosphate synthase small subunit n=1 Tax=Commensalibacter sp. Nvir TaxID=3069817 RepID=UPI002D32F236|nr:Carbamoyl-phosphate synthase small chain [Commensalibacter sp. Nvir]
MNIDTIISRLGGIEQTARITKVSPEAIRKWKQSKAIPSKHWSVIIQETGLKLSDLQPEDTNDTLSNVCPDGVNAVLILQDGEILWGKGFGAYSLKTNLPIGEICFSTSMTGYQETLTDPSFASQLIVFTFPHIGNVGTNKEDEEASTIFAKGLIVKEKITQPSSWRSTCPLEPWLQKHGVTGIYGIDTRALTLKIRNNGPQNALIYWPKDNFFDLTFLQEQVKIWPGLQGLDLAKKVSCDQIHTWNKNIWQWAGKDSKTPERKYKVVAIDYGAKQNIFRNLIHIGCDLIVVPATTTAKEILNYNPDGVFLSNGPADPAATASYSVPTLKELLQNKIPIFGICLGHQLLAHALGGKTYKLSQGHRGANQPVKDLKTGKVEITSQNHGFAVDIKSLPPTVHETHINLFDGSNEGITSDSYPAFSVQYHPEASPGPSDSHYLFARFANLMDHYSPNKR